MSFTGDNSVNIDPRREAYGNFFVGNLMLFNFGHVRFCHICCSFRVMSLETWELLSSNWRRSPLGHASAPNIASTAKMYIPFLI